MNDYTIKLLISIMYNNKIQLPIKKAVNLPLFLQTLLYTLISTILIFILITFQHINHEDHSAIMWLIFSTISAQIFVYPVTRFILYNDSWDKNNPKTTRVEKIEQFFQDRKELIDRTKLVKK